MGDTDRWKTAEGSGLKVSQTTISADSIMELAALLDDCFVNGSSLDAFRRQFTHLVERHEWSWFAPSRTELNRRALLLFRVLSAEKYAHERALQLRGAQFPFWLYCVDQDCGKSHRQWDRTSLPADDPFWTAYTPPLDWDCGCFVVGARSKRAIERLGGDLNEVLSWNGAGGPVVGNLWRDGRRPDLLDVLNAIANDDVPSAA